MGDLKEKRKPKALKGKLLFFIVLCWVLPILLLFTFLVISYRKEIINKSELILDTKIAQISTSVIQRMDEAISASKKPSYEGLCESAWKKYKTGEYNKVKLFETINSLLKNKFYIDKRFQMFVFYLEEEEEPLCYTATNGYSYNSYMEEMNEELSIWTKKDSSDAHVKVLNGKIFIIRNMYTVQNYQKLGTLVVEIDPDKLFQGLEQEEGFEGSVFFNQAKEGILLRGAGRHDDIEPLFRSLSEQFVKGGNASEHLEVDNRYEGFLWQSPQRDYELGIILLIQKDLFYSSLYNLYLATVLILLIMIPVLIYVFRFLNKEITQPVIRMVAASELIQQGRLGTVVETDKMPNAEFDYLVHSFNEMSRQVKHLYDTAYDERLARKDAQIMALQAQINPHFLNNTLEMMNWQARMSGDVTISKMIESLSTVLEYRMDRENNRLIDLSEELRCSDAFLHIISMRFGKRLKVTKEVDESLLQKKVPRLLLQPIIENAVVHGIERVVNGEISIHIYHDECNIYISVRNSGKAITRENQDRIDAILEGRPESIGMEPGRHTSLGIRNVNQRIKLIYGDHYGLSIYPEGEMTQSMIVLPYEWE